MAIYKLHTDFHSVPSFHNFENLITDRMNTFHYQYRIE